VFPNVSVARDFDTFQVRKGDEQEASGPA
jgi:hypothetical protein